MGSFKLIPSLWLLSSLLCKTVAFKSMRTVFVLIQNIWWRVNGVHKQLQQNKDPKCKERKLQALKIITWNKFCLLMYPDMSDFLCIHDEFVSPEYILENDHIYLYIIDKKNDEAIFCEGNPGQLLWKSCFSPFLSLAGFTHGKRFVRVPMFLFREMASKLPDPSAKILCLSNTARCGSTLLCQLFEYTGRVITLSEPPVLYDVAVKYKNEGMTEELVSFTKNAIKMLCKPQKSMPDPVAYIVKPTGPAAHCMGMIKSIFPQTKLLYLYRDMEKVSMSIYRLSWILASVRVTYLALRLNPKWVKRSFEAIGFPVPEEIPRVQDDFTSGVWQAISATNVYTKLQESDEIYGLLFDDIIKNQEMATKAIFKVCGIPQDMVKDAIKAFEQDSQRNSPVSQNKMKKSYGLEICEEDRVRASELLVRCGYPPLNQEFRLRGTVDFNAVLKD